MPNNAKAVEPDAAAAKGARVAVVGGGLAGLTAALRLAQRGFAVTVYEAKPTLGGNFSSDEVGGVYHDVYPHMFCAWYANFWDLFENDLGLARADYFSTRMGVKVLEAGSSEYFSLENATTPQALWANLNSGVLPMADMFLLGFSMLDLAATPFERSGADQLERLDVNGFVYSRGYSNEKVAKLQNYILMVIWSIQSDVTAAASYQDFIKHTILFPHATPFSWLLNGPLYERIIVPFASKLTELGCEIRTGATVTTVELVDDKPVLTIATEANAPEIQQADYVVMATPAPVLANLAMKGAPGARLVDKVPALSEVRRFWGEAIPVVDLYFTRKLPDVPAEQAGLAGSDCDLTILDLSQLWTDDPNMTGRTVLVVAASNGYALTSNEPLEQGHQIISRLNAFLPAFNPGAYWGDPAADIDWEKTHFRANSGNRLFVNDIGSWQWRPVASYPAAPNVFFAGDFCQTDVDMATIEAAVQSGLLAAQALQARDRQVAGLTRGDPITLVKHEVYSDASLLAAKLAMLPLAYAACAWSGFAESAKPSASAAPANSYSPATYSLLLPLAFSLDWWKTSYWLVRKSLPGGESPSDADSLETGIEPGDVLAGLAAKAVAAAGEFFQHLASPPPAAPAQPSVPAALAALTAQAWRTAQAAASQAASAAPYRRRWRAKP
jgi:predicted NAD/FAD-dependent oxidoreductase